MVSIRILLLAAILGGLAFVPQSAGAQQDHQHHGTDSGPASSDAAMAYASANEKMHRDMAIKMTGDPDADFVRGMIPHHQGAVDMAKIVLQYGKDPAVKKLAEQVIASQETEISWMKEWLAKNARN